MIYKVIPLRETENGFTPTLTTYILDDPMEQRTKRPAVVICPGGGYGMCSPREAEPIATQFNQAGFHAFVLDYSVVPFKFPRALEELSMSVAMVRENAEEWMINADKIAVCGFSAGGHLACSLGMFWNADVIKRADQKNKPNAMILSYPVISSGEGGHVGSFDNLCENDEQRKYNSLENQVTKDTPPAFIWHTYTDDCVPVENSMLLASAMRKQNIPFELHIYQKGGHGLSTALPDVGINQESFGKDISTNVTNWPQMAANWLRELD